MHSMHDNSAGENARPSLVLTLSLSQKGRKEKEQRNRRGCQGREKESKGRKLICLPLLPLTPLNSFSLFFLCSQVEKRERRKANDKAHSAIVLLSPSLTHFLSFDEEDLNIVLGPIQ